MEKSAVNYDEVYKKIEDECAAVRQTEKTLKENYKQKVADMLEAGKNMRKATQLRKRAEKLKKRFWPRIKARQRLHRKWAAENPGLAFDRILEDMGINKGEIDG